MEFKPLHLSSSSTNICNKIMAHLDKVFPTNKIDTGRQTIRPNGLKPSLSCLNMFYSPIQRKPKQLSSSMSSKDFSSPNSNSNTSFREIRSSNSKDCFVSPDTLCQQLKEERDKNAQYLKEITILKERIEQLEQNNQTTSPTFRKAKSINDNNDVERLKKELKALKVFKQNVYEISKRYDDVNGNIIKNLKNIELVFNKLNEQRKAMSNDVKIATIEVGYVSFEKVVNIVIDMVKHKQDEYNHLLQQKDDDINELKIKLSRFADNNNTIYKASLNWNNKKHHDLVKQSSDLQKKYS